MCILVDSASLILLFHAYECGEWLPWYVKHLGGGGKTTCMQLLNTAVY